MNTKSSKLKEEDTWRTFKEIEDKYVIIEKVGSGTFSDVYHAYETNNASIHVALKRIKKSVHPDRTLGELQMLDKLKGEKNTSKMIKVLRHMDQITIVMEYIPHVNFKDLLPVMGLEGIKHYMKELFIALEHIHSFEIVHRDLKPTNFLVNPVEHQYKLIDFGLAEHLSNTNKKQIFENKLQGKKFDLPSVSRAGTRGFRAPEILLRHTIQTTAIDMWSAGVILLSLLTNRYPFFQSHDDLYSLTEILNIIPYQEVEQKLLNAYSRQKIH
eukprot:gene28-4279_t